MEAKKSWIAGLSLIRLIHIVINTTKIHAAVIPHRIAKALNGIDGPHGEGV